MSTKTFLNNKYRLLLKTNKRVCLRNGRKCQANMVLRTDGKVSIFIQGVIDSKKNHAETYLNTICNNFPFPISAASAQHQADGAIVLVFPIQEYLFD